MKKLNLFIEYSKLLISFDFCKGSYKDFNLSIYTYLDCFGENNFYLVVNDTLGFLFEFKHFYSFTDLNNLVINNYNFDLSFLWKE